MTKTEAREIRRRARMQGETVSDYVRRSVLETEEATAADHSPGEPTDPLAISSTPKARA